MMAKAKKGNIIGAWSFLVGVVLAVVFGYMGISPTVALVLAAIGLIVGLLNIADEETEPFLMSGVVLIIASALGGSAVASLGKVADVLSGLLLIFVPATIIVAIKNVFSLARN